MEFPRIRILETQDRFDTRLKRLLQEQLPDLSVTERIDGAAIRYEIQKENRLIAEVDTLPFHDKLEIRIAGTSTAIADFCNEFYGMIERTYKIKIPFNWVQLLVTLPIFEEIDNESREDSIDERLRDRISTELTGRLPLIQPEIDIVEEDGTERPSWFPKDTTKFKKLYVEWGKLEEEYIRLYDDGEADDPRPTIADFKVRLNASLGSKYGGLGEKRLNQAIKSGTKGWLE